MRKQTKIAAVVSATALLAIGASFTAMAGEKGTWVPENDGWYCYDADGDVYEDEWCEYNGKDYYVGEDGLMLTSTWVDYDGNMYYANSYGEKTTGAWKLLVPHDDEDADEEWYWFKSSGKMAKSEKLVIGGKTYYFDSEGKMLTGWVDIVNMTDASEIGDNTVFCGEDGARVSKAWAKTTVPGADEDEDDEFWYYIKSTGKATTGKAKSINGETYLFNGDGQMLSGWVASTDSDALYVEIGDEDAAAISTYEEVYFCGDSEDGHVKKNKWIYEWKNTQYGDEDVDNDKNWFWIEKDGTVFVPNEASMSNAQKKSFADAEENALSNNGSALKVYVKNIEDKYYVFNTNGEMLSGLIEINGKVYYFGGSQDGARKTGSVTLTDDYGVEGKFLFSTSSSDKGVGVTGPKSGKLYDNGLLITAKDYKYAVVPVDGNDYIVNRSGSIQTTKKVYNDGDEVIYDAENATFSDDPKGAIAD